MKKRHFIAPAAVTLVAAGVIFGANQIEPLANPLLFSTAAVEDGMPQPNAGPVAVKPPPAQCLGYVALTFDDGPTEGTQDLLDVLSQQHTPATFFLTGVHAEQFPDAVKTIVESGHQIGDHTWDHPDLQSLTQAEAHKQILQTYEVLSEFGKVEFFRPPYGSYDDEMRLYAGTMDMKLALWTLDGKDFEATSTEQIVEQAMGLTDGGNVLLHDNPATTTALPLIINSYHDQGLCFGRLAPSETSFFPAESPALTYQVQAVQP